MGIIILKHLNTPLQRPPFCYLSVIQTTHGKHSTQSSSSRLRCASVSKRVLVHGALFCSKIRGKERETSWRASVTCERLE